MNTDSRGVKRGNCLAENCDCSLYEYEEKNGAKCSYCCCPPTKHQKIDAPEENLEDHSVLVNSSFENYQEKNGSVIQNLIPISSDVFPTSSCSSQLLWEFTKIMNIEAEEMIENTALDEVLPARSDPPHLIAIGDVLKSISLFAYVDGTAVFSEKCPIK
ncbi:hypothetical protein AVEN_29740-1 [Araneus ventricosus]|uniref:Uncharacterized protein n=1 Tax=Araneus ventricosus TaxID=182803 RepID=A0A4Y2PE71_ARAVE|nr:hypothetical protein AVEN_29740-1 [Araneus ventricosus]